MERSDKDTHELSSLPVVGSSPELTTPSALENLSADKKQDFLHVEALTHADSEAKDFRSQANEAEAYEHSLTVWQAAKVYRKASVYSLVLSRHIESVAGREWLTGSQAAFWSFVASLSIVMEGYDLGFQDAVWGMTSYRQYFGQYWPGIDEWQVPAAWQSALSQILNVGAIIGVFLGGVLNDRIGYRKTLLANYLFITPAIALMVFAQNKPMLLMGGLLAGIPWGCFATLGPAYASEVCPLSLRAYLTGWVNICWTLGGFVGTGIAVGTQSMTSNWAWRLPYALQWIWPVPLFIAMWFAPESPWWLVRHERLHEAEVSIKPLAAKHQEEYSHQTLANMVRTTKMEMEFARSQGPSRWRDLFKGTDLRRTEITVLAWLVQNACGNIFAGNAIYVFQQAGMSQDMSFNLGLVNKGIKLLANFFNFYLMYALGRRTIYISGFVATDTLLIAIGVCAIFGRKGHNDAMWAQAVCQILHNFCYTGFLVDLSVIYACWNLAMNYANQYMINPSALDWAGLTAFFWVPICTLCLIWVYFRLPEFKHKSYYEIDMLFERRVSARKFKTTRVERDAEEQIKEDRQLAEDA